MHLQMSRHCSPQDPKNLIVEDGLGSNLFTFCSETASLIKFLTVANVPKQQVELSHPCKRKNMAEVVERPSENCIQGFSGCQMCSTEETENQSNSCSVVSSSNSDLSYMCQNICMCNENTASASTYDKSAKNLIFVTGDFAVALHQLGIKNVSPSFLESKRKRPSDLDIMDVDVQEDDDRLWEQHMVVNFSNNDIHLQHVHKSDKPDHLIDLYGHVTGLALSHDNR